MSSPERRGASPTNSIRVHGWHPGGRTCSPGTSVCSRPAHPSDRSIRDRSPGSGGTRRTRSRAPRQPTARPARRVDPAVLGAHRCRRSRQIPHTVRRAPSRTHRLRQRPRCHDRRMAPVGSAGDIGGDPPDGGEVALGVGVHDQGGVFRPLGPTSTSCRLPCASLHARMLPSSSTSNTYQLCRSRN